MRQVEQLSRQDQAGYLFLALARDLVEHEVAVRWADGMIVATERPESLLLELATCEKRDETLRILRALAGGTVPPDAVKLAAARIGQQLERGELTPLDAARHLVSVYDLAESRDSDDYWQAVALEDDLEPGSVRDELVLEAVRDDLRALLKEFKGYEAHLGFAA